MVIYNSFSFTILKSKSYENQKVFVNHLMAETLPEVTVIPFTENSYILLYLFDFVIATICIG